MKNIYFCLLLLTSCTAFTADSNTELKMLCDYTQADDAQITRNKEFACALINARRTAKSRERAPIFINATIFCTLGWGLTAYSPWLAPVNIATSWFYLKKTQERNLRLGDKLLKITETLSNCSQKNAFPLIDLHTPISTLLTLQTQKEKNDEEECYCWACSIGHGKRSISVASYGEVTPYEYVYEDWNIHTDVSKQYQRNIQGLVLNLHEAQLTHRDDAPKCWKHLIID